MGVVVLRFSVFPGCFLVHLSAVVGVQVWVWRILSPCLLSGWCWALPLLALGPAEPGQRQDPAEPAVPWFGPFCSHSCSLGSHTEL